MAEDLKIDKLLSTWEDTYKKGQLTLWVFIALKEGNKYVGEIKEFVETKSNGTITCEEQSLYRTLRKYEHINVVSHQLGKGDKGPERKYYYLTEIGKELFSRFVKRNIKLFYQEEIKDLLKLK